MRRYYIEGESEPAKENAKHLNDLDANYSRAPVSGPPWSNFPRPLML